MDRLSLRYDLEAKIAIGILIAVLTLAALVLLGVLP